MDSVASQHEEQQEPQETAAQPLDFSAVEVTVQPLVASSPPVKAIPDPIPPPVLEVDLTQFKIAEDKILEMAALGACLENRLNAELVLRTLDREDFKDLELALVFQALLKRRARENQVWVDAEVISDILESQCEDVAGPDGHWCTQRWRKAFQRAGGDASVVATRLREVGKMRSLQRVFQKAMVKAGKRTDYRDLRAWLDQELQPYMERMGDDPRRRVSYWTIDSLRVSENAAFKWDGLLAVGAIAILHAPPKAGKSYLTFGLLKAMLYGEPFLERKTTKSGAVMLTEEGRQTLREKCDRFNFDGALPFYFLSRRDPELAKLGFKEAVKAALGIAQERKAGVLIIDTLSAWSGLQQDEENQAAKIENLFAWLRAEATASHVAVLILHHTAKYGTTARGSTALEGACDAVIRLYTPIEGQTRRVLIPKTRFAETPGRIEYELGVQGFTTQLTDGENYEDVWKALPEEAPGMTAREISEKVNFTKRHVQEVLRKMVKRGIAAQEGKGDKYHPWRYIRPTAGRSSTDPGVSDPSQNTQVV